MLPRLISLVPNGGCDGDRAACEAFEKPQKKTRSNIEHPPNGAPTVPPNFGPPHTGQMVDIFFLFFRGEGRAPTAEGSQ